MKRGDILDYIEDTNYPKTWKELMDREILIKQKNKDVRSLPSYTLLLSRNRNGKRKRK